MKPMSLKMRAISLLSQREHSSLELRRKLLRIAADMRRASASSNEDDADVSAELKVDVDTLLGWLEAQGYLDEARFVESRVHARAQRYGSLRIQQELAQHGLRLASDAAESLKATELARATAIWRRKFSAVVAGDSAARARQGRFLMERGFAPELVRRVLNGALRAEDE